MDLISKRLYKSQTAIEKAWGYVFLFIVSIHMSLTYTELEPFDITVKIITVVEFAFFVMHLINCRYKVKTILAMCFLLMIVMMTYILSGSAQLIIMMMVSIVFIKMDYKKAFKFIFKIRLFMFALIVLMSITGILSIFRTEIPKSGGVHFGFGLGYTHPNRLAYTIQLLVILYILYKEGQFKYTNTFAIFVVTYVGYVVAKSRTLMISVISMMALCYLCKSRIFKGKLVKILEIIATLIMPVLAGLSIVIPNLLFVAPGKLGVALKALNGLLSLRFTYIYRAFTYYPITLFGGTTDFSLLDDLFGTSIIDNGYIRILYKFGIIGFVVFIALSVCSVRRLIKQKQYIFICIYIIVAFWGLSENVLGSFAFNIVIAFWSELFIHRENITIQNSDTFRMHLQTRM